MTAKTDGDALPTHSIEIETVSTWQAGPKFRPACACDWRGKWQDDRGVAQREGDVHVLKARGLAQAIVNEIRAALDRGQKVAFVRVTESALLGSVVGTPVPTGDEEVEILVHPDDWQMLALESLSGAKALETADIFGVPVLHDD